MGEFCCAATAKWFGMTHAVLASLWHDAITEDAIEAVQSVKLKNGGETRPRFPAVYSSTREKKSLPNRLQSHTTTNFATTRSVERGPTTLVDPRRYEMNRPILLGSRLGTDVCL